MAKKTFNSKRDAAQLDALFDQARHRAMLGQWSATVDSDKSRMSITLEITGPTVSGTYRPSEEAVPATEPAAPANLPAEPPAIVDAAAVPAEASPAADVVVETESETETVEAPEAVTPKRRKKATTDES